MASIYEEAKALAIELLGLVSQGGNGAEMTLRRTTTGEYDPEGGEAPVTEEAFTGSAFRDAYGLKDIDGTLIRAGDAKLLVSPVQLNGSDMPTPKQGDGIEFAGDLYNVVSVTPWNYAGVDVGFEVQARK